MRHPQLPPLSLDGAAVPPAPPEGPDVLPSAGFPLWPAPPGLEPPAFELPPPAPPELPPAPVTPASRDGFGLIGSTTPFVPSSPMSTVVPAETPFFLTTVPEG